MFIIDSFLEIGLQSRPTCKTPCQKWIDSCQCWLERCQGIHQPTSWKRNQGEIFFFKCRLRIFYFRLIKKSQSGISWNLTKLSKNRWDWYISFYWGFQESKESITSVKRKRAKFFWLLQTMYLIIAWAFFVLLQTKYLELGTYLFKILRFKSIQVMVRLHTFARNEIIGKICNQTMLERTLVYCMFDLVWPVLNEASSR